MTAKNAHYLFFLVVFISFLNACSAEERQSEHYFLDGYEHLEFRDDSGHVVSPSDYIYSSQVNNSRGYFIADSTLRLYNTRTEEPYTGYIRTFHSRNYNLQGEFEDGKMHRLRYWHANRTLGMDVNYRKATGSIWLGNGNLAVSWNSEEMYYLDPATQSIERIISDTLTSYFDEEGEMEYYTVTRDTAYMNYYPDGTPRFEIPRRGDDRTGILRRWYPNGQLRVEGRYIKGREFGVWVEYDSLGNEIKRIDYSQ